MSTRHIKKYLIIIIEGTFTKIYYLVKYKFFKSNNLIEKPFQTVIVPVALINYYMPGSDRLLPVRNHAHRYLRMIRIAGIIADGDWDNHKTEFINTYTYIAFKERFIKKKKWEDTVYYHKYFSDSFAYRKEYPTWDVYLETRLKRRWDHLYKNMQKNGYISQYKIKGRKTDEIEVVVTRNGELIMLNGKHRLALAKLLNIEEVPVVVRLWHKEYIKDLKINTSFKNTPKEAIKPIMEKNKSKI